MGRIEEHKRIARQVLRQVLTEIVGGGRFDLIEELVADEFVTEPPDGPLGLATCYASSSDTAPATARTTSARNP